MYPIVLQIDRHGKNKRIKFTTNYVIRKPVPFICYNYHFVTPSDIKSILHPYKSRFQVDVSLQISSYPMTQ